MKTTDSPDRLILVARFADRIEQVAYKPEERVRAAFEALAFRKRGADTDELALVRGYKGQRRITVWLPTK